MGLGLIALLLVLVVWNVQGILGGAINLVAFERGMVATLCLLLLCLVAYRTYGILSLQYVVSRDGVIIRWAGIRHFLPMRAIERVVPASDVEERTLFWGLAWPGCWVGKIRVRRLGTGRAYGTLPPSRQLLIITSDALYGISPADARGFLAGFRIRQELGALHPWEPRREESGVIIWPVWSDRYVQLTLLAAFMANLALFGYICAIYPSLSPILPLYFDAMGRVVRLGTRIEVLSLPGIGMILALVDTALGTFLYWKERTCARFLFGFAALIQLLIWNAAARVLP